MQILTALSIFLILNTCWAELKLFQATYRHGDRAPEDGHKLLYPNDPYNNETWYPEGYGGLNNLGKKRAFNLGKFFKMRYGEWLGDLFSSKLVTFYSSKYERTRMTTLLIAAALFPPNKVQTWSKELKWQPIPVWSVDNNMLFNATDACSEYLKLRRKTELSGGLLARSERLQPFFNQLSMKTGAPVVQRTTNALYTQLQAEESCGKVLPKWVRSAGYPVGQLADTAGYDYIIQSYTNEMKKYTGGQWISTWLKNVESYINGDRRKAIFYGGHETNVGAILNALDVFKPHVPMYCSTVIFELHELYDSYYVKFLHKDTNEVEELTIPGCPDVYCPLEIFKEAVADVLPEDDLPCS